MSDITLVMRRLDEVMDAVTSISLKPPEPKKRMMNFSDFSYVYGIPIDTLREWKDERGFAGKVAFKIGSRWYVDTAAFEKWRLQKHRESYRYA